MVLESGEGQPKVSWAGEAPRELGRWCWGVWGPPCWAEAGRGVPTTLAYGSQGEEGREDGENICGEGGWGEEG